MHAFIAFLPSGNKATIEVSSGYKILLYASSGLMNSVFTISFFRSKLKYARWKYVGFFILKISFCRTESPFYDRPRALI